ncbi:MAG TPA: BtrH N-terminal domain-containing protein [Actinocrinis sp.]|nr:BtrH N-terminal domain-containing protein [Actinocrinis sp.]
MTSLTADEPAVWYDDLCSCLQVDIAYVLRAAGWDPVQALGSGWRLCAAKAAVEPVEYYHPAGEALEDYFCLHHPVSLRWHQPADAAQAHRNLLGALARGTPPIVAVNNFHLPFRPAYHDVHAAHLLLVTGFDKDRQTYRVVDPLPPAFAGDLPRSVLEEAREHISIDDESDPFFSGNRPSWRWLEVRTTGPQPQLHWPWLRTVIRGNIDALREPGQGLSALAELIADLPDRVTREGARPLREIYVLGWPAQAEASVHSAFLTAGARQLGRPGLAEAARWVDAVAHAWTGFRVAAAHESRQPRPDPARAAALGRRVLTTWEQCLQRLETMLEERI